MVLYASTSWIKFAAQHLILISATTTNTIARHTLRLSLDSSKASVYLSQRTSIILALLSVLMSYVGVSTVKKALFVGAISDVNCNEFNSYDTVTKKNTQISRLSVLAVVCNHDGHVIIPIVAYRNNTCNNFAVLHV